MWGEALPSGRERAIETLIDSEPQGSFYRTARVLEESVLQTQLHRPNLVTKAALIEQAYSLSKYEIDQPSKYDAVHGDRENASFSDRLVACPKDEKDRILRHHAKILAAKRGTATSSVSPSPQLVASLRQIYGDGDSLLLRSLLQSVMDHPAFVKSEVSSGEEKAQEGTFHLEKLIGNTCQNDDEAVLLHGLLISTLSIVAGYEPQESQTHLKEESDSSVVHQLQVGGILSIMKPNGDDKSPLNLDPDLLSYFGNAASTYEERIEIQKSRLLSRLEDSKDSQHQPLQTVSSSHTRTPSVPAPPSSTPQPSRSPEPTPNANAVPDDTSDDIQTTAAALNAAVFEQIISGATGDENSSQDDQGSDSSASGSEDDSDYEDSEKQRLDHESSSSSSSSGTGPGEDDHQNSEQGDSSEEDDDDNNNDIVLRQALALSLVEQSQSLHIDATTDEQETTIGNTSGVTSPIPKTPGNGTPLSFDEPFEENPDESPLPSIPTPPKSYPYADMMPVKIESDHIEMNSPYFDPSILNVFGSLPAHYVIVHLLRYVLETIERKKFEEEEPPSSPRDAQQTQSISGGIGYSLFPPSNHFVENPKSPTYERSEVAFTLQLLVSLILLIHERRTDAMNHLETATSQETKSTPETKGDVTPKSEESAAASPTSEEGDDPALALALNYIDDETAESSESLEAKGMRRKAAAAAHDAAVRQESLRRKTEYWKQRVKLFSHCTFLTMKSLRLFLQSIVRRWLGEPNAISVLNCDDMLPTTVVSKLNLALASLSSISAFRPLTEVPDRHDSDIEAAYMSLRLYQESLLLWGELVPIMYPSVSAQIEICRSLLSECTILQSNLNHRLLETLTTFPSSEFDPAFHRLQAFCRRLRVSDVLDNFVSSPACYMGETEEETLVNTSRPHKLSPIISMILAASKSLDWDRGELLYLFLALCHRCHARMLLWDGLFASTENEIDDATTSLSQSSGDVLRVNLNPSYGLEFDGTKCSDSMSILSNHGDGSSSTGNGSSVHQRASKVWGTVLSSTCYAPKTGIHRWAVRLDKCERGHVFVGVATTQASTRTYVGGDKYGWGMIGTQALWHDRRKIRGDYGATFRTGSTIIITLDSDAGTLSFGSWRDTNACSSCSVDPMVQNLSSPRRHGQSGGSVEDWGVAFEGLPLDARLYPSVGLYQRDDRVTLLAVESGKGGGNRDSSIDLSGGLCYFPRLSEKHNDEPSKKKAAQVREFNDQLSWDGIEYIAKTLEQIIESVSGEQDVFLLTKLLPSLASTLCLVPSTIPFLSARFALTLVPHVKQCILRLGRHISSDSPSRFFQDGLKEGKWVIRATGSSGSSADSEEYVVDFTSTSESGHVIGFEGNGVGTTGKSKNSLVAIFGTMQGLSLHFVEEWADGNDDGFGSLASQDAASSCVVTARMSLDGDKFEGTYRNVHYGTTGQIAGLRCVEEKKVSRFHLKEAPDMGKRNSDLVGAIATGHALLCLSHSHLAAIVSDDAARDHDAHARIGSDEIDASASERNTRRLLIRRCLASPIFAVSSTASTVDTVTRHLDEVKYTYCPPPGVKTSLSLSYISLLRDDIGHKCPPGVDHGSEGLLNLTPLESLVMHVVAVDGSVSVEAGGSGSFAALCTSDYQRTRHLLICLLLRYCNLERELQSVDTTIGPIVADVLELWRSAVKILEDGVRNALAQKGRASSRESAIALCKHYQAISLFLLGREHHPLGEYTVGVIVGSIAQLFKSIPCERDLELLKDELSRSSRHALLWLVSLRETLALLTNLAVIGTGFNSLALESAAIGLTRILGRGSLQNVKDHGRILIQSTNEAREGPYLDKLAGVPHVLRHAIHLNVHGIFQLLAKMALDGISRRKQGNAAPWIDSMVQSLLIPFMCCFRREDINAVVLESDIVQVLSTALEQHGKSVVVKLTDTNVSYPGSSVVSELHEISEREVSRSVLRAVVSVAHMLVYQCLTCSHGGGISPTAISRCLEMVWCNLHTLIPSIKKELSEAARHGRLNISDEQWEKWCETQSKATKGTASPSLKKDSEYQVGRYGVAFLRQHGMAHTSGTIGNPQKPSGKGKSLPQLLSSRTASDSTLQVHGPFCHHFLSHWLHILVVATENRTSRDSLAKDPRWMKLLFGCVGLGVEYKEETNEVTKVELAEDLELLLPGRYRLRVLRLLLPLLGSADPSKLLARNLFGLSASSSLVYSRREDEDEVLVAREVVSLLRNLHSPKRKNWRSCVNSVIEEIVLSESVEGLEGLGLLLFFNGGLGSVGLGSFVLLKPPAAVALSTDHQAALSSKSHTNSTPGGSGSGSGSTPHHIVGNGTTGVVAGLCRDEASAGIVSSIEMKNGVCEVILLNRAGVDDKAEDLEPHNFKTRYSPLGRKGSSASRHTMTVRALRSPLADVVQAPEVPLFLDGSVPTGKFLSRILKRSLMIIESHNSISKLDSNGSNVPESLHIDQLRSTVAEFSCAVMSIRSTISLLSDQRILRGLLCDTGSTEILFKLLEIACPDAALAGQSGANGIRSSNGLLSSLPSREAKWVHLASMMRSLGSHLGDLHSLDDSIWKNRSENYMKRLEDASAPGDSDDTANHNAQKEPPSSSLNTRSVLSGFSSGSDRASIQELDSSTNRAISQSTAGSENSEDEDDSEAAAAAAAHLREASIAQMAELGLPRSWSELALRRTGGANIEAAVHFCLERGGEMERLLAEERERDRMMQRQSSGGSSARRRGSREAGTSNQLLRQLLEMGFPSRWCAEALAATGNNVDEALTWILTNGERLSAEDEGMDFGDDDNENQDDDDDENSHDDDDDDSNEFNSSAIDDTASKLVAEIASDDGSIPTTVKGWQGSVAPLRFISGRSIIHPTTLAISGLPTGGFSSVGTKGVLLTSGKWYYEAILETAGCLQIGWADGSFAGHCHADRGDGCGDGPSSWAYDGWRRYRWHATATEWGCRWKEGDVIGCLVDMDQHIVSFTLNGKGEEIGMGVAFSGKGFRPCGGVYACVSFNRREKLRLVLGGDGNEQFQYLPPAGYNGVGKAVLAAVEELESLVTKEAILDIGDDIIGAEAVASERESLLEPKKRFLCDFSDGEHGHELMAWAHRYYGSDASVHLGSSRMKPSIASSKATSTTAAKEVTTDFCLTRRVEGAWAAAQDISGMQAHELDAKALFFQMERGYLSVAETISKQMFAECRILARLFAKKLLLHIVITMGDDFDPQNFISPDAPAEQCVLRLWRVIEESASLRSAGWVGEAGAMAIAAEALGLGISSNDGSSSRLAPPERPGLASMTGLDEGVVVPTGGIVQVLSSVLEWGNFGHSVATSCSVAASAEASIGTDGGGGVLVFLLEGLRGALRRSGTMQKIALASIRRSVRLLAVVEYDRDDSASVDPNVDDEDMQRMSNGSTNTKTAYSEEDDPSFYADARFVSFLTGLLLGPVIKEAIEDHNSLSIELFEAWSVGMLSASLPWRMVCAFTAAGILNSCPQALPALVASVPTLARFYGRLKSTVSRRAWAERAAVPVCSRYSQAMVELVCSVDRAVQGRQLNNEFARFWSTTSVDAATPLAFDSRLNTRPDDSATTSWEAEEGWVSSDMGWELWTGTVDYLAVDWKAPSRSAVRTLMDGGDGPPMLREGCTVMRGLDWENLSKTKDEDGKLFYESEKAKRDEEKSRLELEEIEDERVPQVEGSTSDPTEDGKDPVAGQNSSSEAGDGPGSKNIEVPRKKRKKIPSPKLPVGTVLSIEPWNGIPAMARKVRWNLTGEEGIYRYGGDGGRYDISHVEINEKATRVRKRHPLPESAEQCAARHGFGAAKRYIILLRLKRSFERKLVDGSPEVHRQGIMEWPDFGAAVSVDCVLHPDGAFTLVEKDLIYGAKDSGWEPRFGQPAFVPGTVVVLSPTGASNKKNQAELDAKSPFQSMYEELLGSCSFVIEHLRNREDGSTLRLTSETRLFRGHGYGRDTSLNAPLIQSPLPAPIYFDRAYHASSLSLSRDGRTVSCVSSDGRGTAFASVGFTKGVHYWEVKLEQADIGSVYIGVAEKPSGSGSGSSHGHDSPPRLNRWHGWGFVNFRATYAAGAERIYGAHCHAGDTVGVLLDCDSGRVSFFFDGLKYGEHILNDLGCAFENISPFGFNVDGCGSGGAGQGAPSGIEGSRSGRYPAQGAVRPRALWPVVGLRNHGDRVTFSPKWNSSYGVDGVTVVKNVVAVNELMHCFGNLQSGDIANKFLTASFPGWFLREGLSEYHRWRSNSCIRASTRGGGPYKFGSFGLDFDLDSSPLACASASALLGLKHALLAGDRVSLKRSAGRILELAEEAIVLGAYQGRLYYQIVSQKSEGGSLTEGGGRAWCWDESEVVDGLSPLVKRDYHEIELPLMDRFRCTSTGGLRIVYEGGAVVRSDLEIFDGSINLGTIPVNSIIALSTVHERRVNSCGVVRYRVSFEGLEGWISSRIRGGKEEAIVSPVLSADPGQGEQTSRISSSDCANVWHIKYKEHQKIDRKVQSKSPSEKPMNLQSFESLVVKGVIPDLPVAESDAFLAQAVAGISDLCEGGNPLDVPFNQLSEAIAFAVATSEGRSIKSNAGSMAANQTAATLFAALDAKLPSVDQIMARVALLRSFNRRARLALPWLSLRPCQEGAALFGGLCGHGASIDRAGRHRKAQAAARWVQIPSIASRVRSLRKLFFTSVKRDFLRGITEVTTTPTPLSHDEYELPREIRTVRINRLKAKRVMSGTDVESKRKHSVFSQLHNETKTWGGAALRRSFVAKGHGGQKRAFKVKLIGEGVNDYSGPYREAFACAMSEIIDLDAKGEGSLGVLDPTPNTASEVGENRSLFMFSLNGWEPKALGDKELVRHGDELRIKESFSSLTAARDETSREVEEALVFLGRLTGTAFRHGIPLDLPLPMEIVWKAIVEEPNSTGDCLREIDALAYNQSGGGVMPSALLWWQQRMLNAFVEGLANVLPVEVLAIFSGVELRDMVCGNPDVDVDLLRRIVEYEGYKESDDVIGYFWDTLREFTNEERKSFLQFVWARNRLPLKESDFDAPFKIQRDNSKNGDQALPSASTCFFSLSLPEYKSKRQLKEKLIFAISNVATMETDFQTNRAEIAEGYRAF